MTGIITVASGKGGTGKTWFSLSLAQALALAPGRRVLVVDGDWGLANADVQLGMLAPSNVVVDGTLAELAASIRPVPGAGIDLLATASGSGALADLDDARHEALAHKVQAIARDYDWAIVDLASGADRSLRHWWRIGRRRLLVVTPDPGAITDAYAFLKLCARDGDARRAQVVVNRAPSRVEGDATGSKLAKAAERFLGLDVKRVLTLGEDPRVTSAIRQQRPFVRRYPTAPTTVALESLARRFERAQNPTAAPSLRLSEAAT